MASIDHHAGKHGLERIVEENENEKSMRKKVPDENDVAAAEEGEMPKLPTKHLLGVDLIKDKFSGVKNDRSASVVSFGQFSSNSKNSHKESNTSV